MMTWLYENNINTFLLVKEIKFQTKIKIFTISVVLTQINPFYTDTFKFWSEQNNV